MRSNKNNNNSNEFLLSLNRRIVYEFSYSSVFCFMENGFRLIINI